MWAWAGVGTRRVFPLVHWSRFFQRKNPTLDHGRRSIEQAEQQCLALSWDAENHLTSSTKNGVVTTYQYDYLSRRISKETNGITTTFVYDGWNVIAEHIDTTLDKIYTWGMDVSGSMQGVGGVGGLLTVTNTSNNEVSYPTYDGNGNVSEYMQAGSGSSPVIVAHYEYDAFGNVIDSKTTGSKAAQYKYKFSTKPQDSETGYYYYGYRYYSAETGKWLSRDPIEEEGGENLYGFVYNNPTDDVDYLGNLNLKKCKQKAREMRPHIDELVDHYSPNHCHALRNLLNTFTGNQCKKWAANPEIAKMIAEGNEIYSAMCFPQKQKLEEPLCRNGQCQEVRVERRGFWKNVLIGGAVVGGGAIIAFDIVTIPSGEGACGVLLISWAMSQ